MSEFDPISLAKLAESDPEKYREIISRLSVDWAEDALKFALAQKCRQETQEGFEAFYEGIHKLPMLPHLREISKDSFRARAEGKIWLMLGFRGSRKTTTMQITKKAWLHGLHPEGTGVITGANDPNAKLIAKSIAQIIEHHPFFKMAFPYVVVDKDRGWGAEGYWIRKTHEDNGVEIPREEWVRRQAAVNDPSFIGGGYKSSEINGKHPTLYLGADDLHDIDSSGSVTEREAIKTAFFFQILPTVPRQNDKYVCPIELTGVPFAKDDTYSEIRKSGGSIYTHLPVMTRAQEGDEGAVFINGINPETGAEYEDIKGYWILTSPTLFGVKSIIEARSRGKSVFWQMYMCDMEVAKTQGLTYYIYDHEKISWNLPTVGGADPTGIDPDHDVGGKKRSSFALAYLCRLQQGGAVIKDGVLKPMGIKQAKEAILQAQTMFPRWETTGVEGVGVGKVFQQYLRLDSRVRFLDSNIKTPDHKSVKDKLVRFEYEVAPHLESGLIRISNENTPFLNALRFGLDNFFDLDPKQTHEALDAMDSVYHAVKLIPDLLRVPSNDDVSPYALQSRGGLQHPFFGNVGVQ